VKRNVGDNTGLRFADDFATLPEGKYTLAWICSVPDMCEGLFGKVRLILLFGEVGAPLVLLGGLVLDHTCFFMKSFLLKRKGQGPVHESVTHGSFSFDLKIDPVFCSVVVGN
jgi:hypothetical protein